MYSRAHFLTHSTRGNQLRVRVTLHNRRTLPRCRTADLALLTRYIATAHRGVTPLRRSVRKIREGIAPRLV